MMNRFHFHEKNIPGQGRGSRGARAWAAWAFLGAGMALFAMEPPRPGDMERYRTEGTLAAREAFAREIGNHKVAPRLVRAAGDRLEALAAGGGGPLPTPPSGWRGMPTRGTVKVLALLIDFKGTPGRTSSESLGAMLFGDGSGAPPYESLRNFYRRASYGQLEILGDTLGWYTTAYTRKTVPMTTEGREGLIEEALLFYEGQGHDFSQYDNDGDGAIDYFLVIWTGGDNGWGNFWWGYQTRFSDASFHLDGKRLGDYSWQWESNPYPGTFSPRVAIHETGHALGLPDYYDYDGSVGPPGGVGGLDQMDGNWGDHNCFSKFLLDWLTPSFCGGGSPGAFALGPSGGSAEALLMMPGAGEGTQFGEFYMAQYRDLSGNDLTYPGQGLLVWHLDARLNGSGSDYLFDNSYTEHKLLRLMEADGLEEIEGDIPANAGDFYGPGKSIGPSTFPSTRCYSGRQSGVAVQAIEISPSQAAFTARCAFDGPYLEHASHTWTDSCSAGGTGGGDGIADPGEDLLLFPVLRNDGTLESAGTLATLSSDSPLVAVTAGSATYGTIAPGEALPPLTPFSVSLGRALPCGTEVPFRIHATAGEGAAGWDSDFTLRVGRDRLFEESFETWPLEGPWTVVDDSNSGMPWGSGFGYGCRTNKTGGTGDFASADADCHNGQGIETTLISPPFDLTGGLTRARLEFKTDLQDYYGTTRGYVDLSTDGGSAWIPLASYAPGSGIPASGLQSLDLGAYLGMPGLRFRFRYFTAAWEVWWQIDDVGVATQCRVSECAVPCPGTPPTVQRVTYAAAAKKLKVYGAGFAQDAGVSVDGAPLATLYKSPTYLIAKGVPKIAKKQTVTVRVTNAAQGCLSEPFAYKRP